MHFKILFFCTFGLTAYRKRHSDVIERAQRLKLDDLNTGQGRGTGTEREQESGLTTDDIQVSENG